MKPGEAADVLVDRVRSRPWGLAVAAVADGEVSTRIDAGVDPVDASTTYQWGSITKTMTGVLAACAIERGELRPGSSLGEVLGVRSAAGAITVGELVTHRSGLPRLPANLDLSAVDQADPYADYTEGDLLDALETCELGRKEYGYSNFGFMVLGHVLARASGCGYPELVRSRILDPLAMSSTGCPPAEAGRAPGYSGPNRVPWWSTQLPGAGGVGGSITDLATYLVAHLEPPEGTLGAAINRATNLERTAPLGYGWGHRGGGWFHDGGTGGFRSFVAFHRATGTAVALLANSAQAEVVTSVGFETITEMAQDNRP